MKSRIKTVYFCDFCNRKYLIKSACEKHELKCKKNPINIGACYGCNHLIKSDFIKISDNPLGGEIESKINILFCKKMNKGVVPRWSNGDIGTDVFYDKKNNEFYNEKMPLHCKEKNN